RTKPAPRPPSELLAKAYRDIPVGLLEAGVAVSSVSSRALPVLDDSIPTETWSKKINTNTKLTASWAATESLTLPPLAPPSQPLSGLYPINSLNTSHGGIQPLTKVIRAPYMISVTSGSTSH
ncbi:hypothetical protein FRC11_000327, partial [Ceratobasidium sp. 423]